MDPSYRETNNDDYLQRPAWYTLEEVLQHSANADPKWSPYTYEIISGFVAQHQERDYISSTMVNGGCPRSSVLERKEDYIATLDSFYPAFMGTMIHAILEKYAREGSVAEYRFHTTIDGIPFSCSPDLIEGGRMWDYKRTDSVPLFGDMWWSHSMQLQFNRYVVNHAERVTFEGKDVEDLPFNPRTYKFDKLNIVYLGPKGPKIITDETGVPYRKKDGEWARNKRKVPKILTDEEVLEGKGYELRRRINAMAVALDSYPKWPKGLEEYWIGPPSYKCPGSPFCKFPACLAKRFPDGLRWER